MESKPDPKQPDQSASEDEKEVLEITKHLALNEIPATKDGKFSKDDLSYIESEGTWEKLGIEQPFIERLIQQGYKKPSRIQFDLIRAFKNANVVGQAQNGSGKTLAYLIPCVQTAAKAKQVTSGTQVAPAVIIIADTSALIQQISKILKLLVKDLYPIAIDELYTGKKEANPKTTILISTMMQLKNSQMRKTIDFSQLALVVVDEADHVFEQDIAKNFFLLLLAKHIQNTNLKLIFTSATMTEIFREVIKSLQEKQNFCVIEKEREELTLKNVDQFVIHYSTPAQKLQFLEVLMQKVNAQNILVFDNKKTSLTELHKFLQEKNFKSELVFKQESEAGQPQSNPEAIKKKIDDFLAGKYRIMLTTNLLSRGIDMRKVTLVINFSLPFKLVEEANKQRKVVDVETYLHRIGRTGRFGDFGLALNFVNDKAEAQMMEEIKKYYKSEIKEIDLNNMDQLNKELQKIDQANHEKRSYLEEIV